MPRGYRTMCPQGKPITPFHCTTPYFPYFPYFCGRAHTRISRHLDARPEKGTTKQKKNSTFSLLFFFLLRSGTWAPLLLVVTRVLAPKASRPITHHGVLFARLRQVDSFPPLFLSFFLSFFSWSFFLSTLLYRRRTGRGRVCHAG